MAKKPPTESSPSIGSITQSSDERTKAMERLLGPSVKSEAKERAKRKRASTGCGCSVCRPPEDVKRRILDRLGRDFNDHEDRENLKAIEMLDWVKKRKRPRWPRRPCGPRTE